MALLRTIHLRDALGRGRSRLRHRRQCARYPERDAERRSQRSAEPRIGRDAERPSERVSEPRSGHDASQRQEGLASKPARFIRGLLLALPALLFGTGTSFAAESPEVEAPHIKARLVTSVDSVRPGQAFLAALVLEPDPHWHTYWENPGDTGLKTRLEWTLPKGAEAGAPVWPAPERIEVGGLVNFGFHGTTILPVEIKTSANALSPDKAGAAEGFAMSLTARWLVCEEVCIPGKGEFHLTLPWAEAGKPMRIDRLWAPRIAKVIEGRRLPLASARFQMQGGVLTLEALTDVAGVDADAAKGDAPNTGSRKSVDPGLDSGSGPDNQGASEADAGGNPTAAAPTPSGMAFFPLTEALVELAAPISTWREGAHVLVRAKLKSDVSAEALDALDAFTGVFVKLGAGESEQYFVSASRDPSWVPPAPPADISVAAGKVETRAGASALPLMLLFGFLGGLVLNLMPCVFPVLSLKVVKLVEHGALDASRRRAVGLAYTAGTVVTFLAIAAVLLGLRAGGEQIGWGFQLQSPVFVTLMAYLLFFLGLSLSGVFELGAGLTQAGNLAVDDSKLLGSFATGALATVVATPCTAPFMGSAMGFAVSQPPIVALAVFASLGLGLAAPFLIVAWVPTLGRALPRPGRWMQTLKEVLAFPLYLTAVWLLWVLVRQVGPDALAKALIGLVMLGLAGWFYRGVQTRALPKFAWLGVALSLVLALVLVERGGQKTGPHMRAEVFSEQALGALLDAGRPVFVNFTADWCITCKVNERAAIERAQVAEFFNTNDISYLKGDWSLSDPAITEVLERFGRSGVPLYLVYRADNPTPEILPQLLTPETIISAFKRPRD